jgi:uroporphyrinogen-III synthase
MNAPLAGWGIVVTRPLGAAEPLADELRHAGARAFVFPALALEDIEPSAATRDALDQLPRSALAVFVSANAVAKGLALALRRGAWPAGTRIAAIGEATAAELRNAGFADVISPAGRHDSEALLALPELQSVQGRTIVVFRGHGGREHLRETLVARGANVLYVESYRRVRPAADPAKLLAAWSRGEIHAVSVLSAETLENFVSLVGPQAAPLMAAAVLVVPHEAIGRHPAARNFSRVVVAGHGARGMIDVLTPLLSPQ